MNRLRQALKAVMRDANDPHLAGLQKTTIALVEAALAEPEQDPLLKMLAHRARTFPNYPLGYHIPEVFAAIGEAPPDPEQEPVACLVGMKGSAFDSPKTKRAYTYEHQPGNVVAYKLGSARVAATKRSAGDHIDHGLILPHELHNQGFGVFDLGAEYTSPQPIEKAPKDGTQILAYGTYQWEDYEDMEKTGYAVIFWRDEEKKWKLANANPYSDFMQPTWWMHLPPEQKIIDTTPKI